MKTSAIVLAAALLAFAAGSLASNVASPAGLQPDQATLLINPDATKKTVVYDGSADGGTKVRSERRRCRRDDPNCQPTR